MNKIAVVTLIFLSFGSRSFFLIDLEYLVIYAHVAALFRLPDTNVFPWAIARVFKNLKQFSCYARAILNSIKQL